MSSSRIDLRVAAAVTLHHLEEALFLPSWVRTRFQLSFHPKPRAYWITTSLVRLLAWLAVPSANLWPALAGLPLALSGLAFAMAINAIFPRLIVSLTKRSYSPGTAPAKLLVLPSGIWTARVEFLTGFA